MGDFKTVSTILQKSTKTRSNRTLNLEISLVICASSLMSIPCLVFALLSSLKEHLGLTWFWRFLSTARNGCFGYMR